MQQNTRQSNEMTASHVRQETREPRSWTAEVTPLPSAGGDVSTSHRGVALDESPSGLCVQLHEPVAVGGSLAVTLRDPEGRVTRETVARVTWCRPREGGRYNAGLAVTGDAGELLCIEHTRRRTPIELNSDS